MGRIKISADDNKFFVAYYDEEHKLFEQIWLPESEYMTNEDYKATALANAAKGKELGLKIDLYLLDNRNFLFVMAPEMQTWQAENVSSKVADYVTDPAALKVAIIMSSDFISQLSIEQAINEGHSDSESFRYFDDVEEAREWLLGT